MLNLFQSYLDSILTTQPKVHLFVGRVVWFYTKFVGSTAIFNQVYYSNPNLNYFTTEMMKILLLCY